MRIYIDMVADLFHIGHLNLFKTIKKNEDNILIVGIHNDKDVESYKRIPIIPFHDRIEIIKSCRYVDHVIGNAPLYITKEYIALHDIDMVMHAHSPHDTEYDNMYKVPIEMGIFKRLEYTQGISTTQIIDKIINNVSCNK